MSIRSKSFREFAKFRLDPQRRLLWHQDEPVNLPLKEIELLCALTENAGEVVTKDELLQKVWQEAFVEESNLSRRIYSLRKIFKEFGEREDLIQTVPRRGYRFAGEVREVADAEIIIERHALTQTLIEMREETQGQADTLTTAGAPAAVRGSRSLLHIRALLGHRVSTLAVASASLIILIGGLVFWRYENSRVKASAHEIRSIAVLPFKTIDAGHENEHQGLGMADILITRLSNLKELNVRPTTAILAFENQDQDSVTIGLTMKVDAVLEGAIYHANDKVRVTARLIRVGDQSSLWAGQFEKPLQDELRLQDEISLQVVDALVLNLSGDERNALTKRYTDSADAYQLYLKGRYQWNKRNAEGMTEAQRLFRNAIEKDPSFALAYVGLADTLATINSEEAAIAVERALELDPNLAEGYATLGFIKMFREWKWAEAESSFKNSLELNPGYAPAHQWYATLLEIEGRYDESKAELQRALEINPLSHNFLADLGQAYYFAHEYDTAKEYCRKSLEVYPDFHFAHWYLSDISLQTGDFDAAVDELLKTDASDGISLGRSGLEKPAEDYLAACRRIYRQHGIKGFLASRMKSTNPNPSACYANAKGYAFLGEKEKALDNLEEAYRGRAFMTAFVKADPVFEVLRPEPRYQAILNHMGLAQ